ncbi:MAG: dTMP kinase [Calditrichaeota bacterium]|nr:dTMP kinase [Calditrichota bacterium]
MPGKLITLEGIDGSGKSTQAASLAEYLRVQGNEVVLLREPGGTPVGEAIRQILLGDVVSAQTSGARDDIPGAMTEFLLFSAARAALVRQVIAPALDQGRTVLLDRFYDSSDAYQAFGRGLDREFVRNVNRHSAGGLVPERTLLFDLTPDSALKRIPRPVDRMEREGFEFLARVREGYLAIAREEPHRIRVIDASQPQVKVFEDAKRALEE